MRKFIECEILMGMKMIQVWIIFMVFWKIC